MRPSDYSQRQYEYDRFKESIQIGIYGYFNQPKRKELIKLREFLKSSGLNAKLSLDIENHSPEIISYEADAMESSEILYNNSDIHIFIISPRQRGRSNQLLDSVSMEYGWAYRDRCQRVGVYFRKGFDISTLPLGACHKMRDIWVTDSFINISEIFSKVTKFCEDKIREMYLHSDDEF
jgi:hypothetical protein